MSGEIERLLEQHQVETQSLKEKLKDVLVENEYDTIWLLRYILSYKTADAAEPAARFAIQWRKENRTHIESAKRGEKLPMADLISQFQVVGEHKYTSLGEPVFYVRIGLCNTKALMDNVPYETVLHFMTFSRIQAMEYCDKESRKQGRFIRGIGVLDFQGFSLTRGNDARFSKIIGESSKLNEKLYPQLLGRSVMVNFPSYFMWIVNLTKPLMSKRAVEKLVFCPGKLSGKSISECPYLSNYFKMEDVPTFLGGQCNCPGGCIGGVSNSQTEPLSGVSSDGLSKMSIGARTSQLIECPVQKGMILTYTVKAESKHVSVKGWFQDEKNEKKLDLFQQQHLDDAEKSITGTFSANESGMVILSFDNTESLIWSKTVLYKVDYDMSGSDVQKQSTI